MKFVFLIIVAGLSLASPTLARMGMGVATPGLTPASVPSITSVTDDVLPSTGTLSSGATTNDDDLTVRVSLTGTGAADGDSAQLYDGSGTGSPLGSAYMLTGTDVSNGYADVQTGTLSDGTYTITARVTVSAVESGASSNSFVLTINTVVGSGNLAAQTVTFENPTAGSIPAKYTTWAMPFAVGDVQTTDSLKVNYDATDFPVQMDVKATWGDGSIRHAALTALAPALTASATQAATLSLGSASNPSCASDKAALIAGGYDSTHAITAPSSAPSGYISLGTINTSAATLLGGTTSTWLDGCLAKEYRAETTVNSGKLKVTVDVRSYADGSAQTDWKTHNDWWFTAGREHQTYNIALSQTGASTLSFSNVPHFIYGGWHRVVDPEVRAHVRMPKAYVLSTGMLPRLDTSITANTTVIDSDYASLNSATTAPMTGAGVTKAGDGGGGFKEEVGPVPGWVGRYLLSQSHKSFAVVTANADAWMAMPFHWPDENSGEPIIKAINSGTATPWSTANNHYDNFTNDSFQPAQGDGSKLQPVNGWWRGQVPWSTTITTYNGVGWIWDSNGWGTHLPDIMYPAYLFTGRRVYLDEVKQFAASVVFSVNTLTWPYHGGNWGGNANYRFGAYAVGGWNAVRGVAGAGRVLANAAAVIPDSDSLKTYFNTIVKDGVDAMHDCYVTEDCANGYGPLVKYIPLDGAAARYVSPWMHASLSTAFQQTAISGHAVAVKAATMAGYFSSWFAGRYTNKAAGMEPVQGTQFGFFPTTDGDTGDAYIANVIQDWGTFYSSNVADYTSGFGIGNPGETNLGGSWVCAANSDNYALDDLGALAGIVTVTADLRALKAWAFLTATTQRAATIGTGCIYASVSATYGALPMFALAPKLPSTGRYLEMSQFTLDMDGGASATLTAPTDGNDHIVASADATTSTLTGAPNVANILYARNGTATLAAGLNSSGVLIGGEGTTTMVDNTGSQVFLTADAATTIQFETASGGTDQVGARDSNGIPLGLFDTARDSLTIASNLNGNGLTTAGAITGAGTVVDGNCVLHLGGGATHDITFTGIASCGDLTARITVP